MKIPREEPITRAKIDELLRFLPVLSQLGKDLEPQWDSTNRNEEGILSLPHPVYPDVVNDFFKIAAQPWWRDLGYDPQIIGKMIRSDEVVAAASMLEIKAMITFSVRGERFCDGLRRALIKEGRIGAILCRLRQLRESVN